MSGEDGFSLANAKIAIIGLGLMGGSLAMALRGKCKELMAVVHRSGTGEQALRMQIVSQADVDPAKILPQADVIILSTPVPAILDWLRRLPELVPQNCIIIDMGSSKQIIIQEMNQLPERFNVLGGHPICGKENLSLDNAEEGLYRNAPFVLTPPARFSVRASEAALQIIYAIGARPVWLDALIHDRMLAFTSHLPFLLACALAMAAPEGAAPLVGPGFNSTSRLASTPSSMMLGILQTNRDNILEAISIFKDNLDTLEQAVRSKDTDHLAEILDGARLKRQRFI